MVDIELDGVKPKQAEEGGAAQQAAKPDNVPAVAAPETMPPKNPPADVQLPRDSCVTESGDRPPLFGRCISADANTYSDTGKRSRATENRTTASATKENRANAARAGTDKGSRAATACAGHGRVTAATSAGCRRTPPRRRLLTLRQRPSPHSNRCRHLSQRRRHLPPRRLLLPLRQPRGKWRPHLLPPTTP